MRPRCERCGGWCFLDRDSDGQPASAAPETVCLICGHRSGGTTLEALGFSATVPPGWSRPRPGQTPNPRKR